MSTWTNYMYLSSPIGRLQDDFESLSAVPHSPGCCRADNRTHPIIASVQQPTMIRSCFTVLAATTTLARVHTRYQYTATSIASTAADGLACSWWYDTTAHGSAFRNVTSFGAIGDGVHDSTRAIQAAIDFQQTGADGSNLSKSPATLYFPPGVYAISDTLVMWYATNFVGNPLCPPTLFLLPQSPGFNGSLGYKPVVAANSGYNISAAHHAWWVQEKLRGGASNDLFYATIRNINIRTGAGNDGAVGLLWAVAQQTAVRNVVIDLRASGAIGIDEGGSGYASPTQPVSLGGGGVIEDSAVIGGIWGMRIAASQFTYRNITISGASAACVTSTNMAWAHVFVGLRASACPVALVTSAPAPGCISLLDSTLGPGLGAVAVQTGGAAGLYLQNVAVLGSGTDWVVDHALAVSATVDGLVSSWGLGPIYIDGKLVASNGSFMPLPSAAAAVSSGVPLACDGNLCGGSAETPASGIPNTRSRPDLPHSPFVNAVTDFGAVGDGVTDDTSALRSAFAASLFVFLPAGVYAVSDSLSLQCNGTLVGEGLSTLALLPFSPGYGDPSQLKAVLITPSAEERGCSVWVSDVALSTLGGGNEGALLLNHQSGPGSSFWDVTIRLYYKVGLKVRFGSPTAPSAGAGYLSNVWFWGADHNLTDLVEMSCAAPGCESHRPVNQTLGALVYTSGPLFLIGSNWEHSSRTEYALIGAQNVLTTALQTEGSSDSLVLHNTTLVVVYGTVFGSGVGGGQAYTFSSTRPDLSVRRNCVGTTGGDGAAAVQFLDVSYRAHGVLQKKQAVSLFDTAYNITQTPASNGWAAMTGVLNSCSS